MREYRIIRKTGNYLSSAQVLFGSFLLFTATLVFAGELRFSAEVESKQIAMDETVALKLIIRSEGSSGASDPEFNAPDFQIVGESSSLSVSSQYDASAGGFSTVRTQEIIRILQPNKTGSLKISHIQIKAGGQVYQAPDVTVMVSKAGTGNPGGQKQQGMGQPFNYPPGFSPNIRPGYRNPRSRAQNSPGARTQGTRAMVRSETDKTTYYKGEQVIVNYYLYHQMRVFNIQVDKFPVLNSFLREDLDVPVIGQRLESEQVVLGGVPYSRALLAQYAAYPLEDGKLSIDSMSLKFNYYQNEGGLGEDEDPFFGFFQQMAPRIFSGKSDPLIINVIPLPEQDRPKSFTGGVGKFDLVSAIDKYQVHANDTVTLTVKVEGKGNISVVQAPQTTWPENLELYDSKGKTLGSGNKNQSKKSGIGTKVFEYVLIPRAPGKLNLPALEFSFFDPEKKQYYTKSTEPIQLDVLDAAPGTSLIPVQKSQEAPEPAPSVQKNETPGKLRPLKPLHSKSMESKVAFPLWRYLYWGFLLAVSALIGLMGLDSLRKLQGKFKRPSTKKVHSQLWESLKTLSQNSSGASWQDMTHAYVKLSDEILDAIDRTYSVGARSFSRKQLEEMLVTERGLSPQVWEKIVQLLEFSEQIRFASSSGASIDQAARNDLPKWVKEGETIIKELETPA